MNEISAIWLLDNNIIYRYLIHEIQKSLDFKFAKYKKYGYGNGASFTPPIRTTTSNIQPVYYNHHIKVVYSHRPQSMGDQIKMIINDTIHVTERKVFFFSK